MSTATTTALRVEPGFVFPAETIVVDATEQRRLHGHCSIPPERYGDYCDIGLLARRTITLNTAAIQASRPGLAPVHVVHRLRQHAPAALGEAFRMEGRYVEIAEARRGQAAQTAAGPKRPRRRNQTATGGAARNGDVASSRLAAGIGSASALYQ